MRERINRLARGILNPERPELVVIPERLELPVRRGELLRTELSVNSANGIYLKGLIYSDHICVRVLRPSFGNRKNQLLVEVDARKLQAGEEIRGNLKLVTDGGEQTVPFLFHVTDGTAGNILEKLDSLESFAKIARLEPEAALRIFEYREFPTAAFMRDLKLRALYEAFRRGPDRASALEEFLVAAGAKKRALVRAETENGAEGAITLLQLREGYFRLTATAEGSFIRLPKRYITISDFTDGVYEYEFELISKALHEGKNEGRIRFSSETMEFSVPVTVFRERLSGEAKERAEREREKERFAHYLYLRLHYAVSGDSAEELLDEMETALAERHAVSLRTEAEEGAESGSTIKEVPPAAWNAAMRCLLRAELAFRRGETERCTALILEAEEKRKRAVRTGVLLPGEREDGFFFRYLAEALRALIRGGEQVHITAERVLSALSREGHAKLLPVYLLLSPESRDMGEEYYALLLGLYRRGDRSPFLFAELAGLYEKNPGRIRELGRMELAVLRFGLSHKLPGAAAAAAYTAAAASVKSFTALHFPLLSALYERYPSAELLTAICKSLIRSDRRDAEAHSWYMRGFEQKIRLTGLNEYLVSSMQSHTERALPHEILLYFVYDNRLDERSREKLYANLAHFRKQERELWEEYRKQIEDFALGKLLTGSVNSRLAELYRAVLRDDILDQRLAAVLPGILNTRRITAKSEWIRSVIVVYPELQKVERVRLEKGSAYVPVYSDQAVFLFEDAYENRFAASLGRAEEVCSIPGLKERCARLDPEGRPAMLAALRSSVAESASGRLSPESLRTVRLALDERMLSEGYKSFLRGILVRNGRECVDYLLSADKSLFDSAERTEIFRVLLDAGHWMEAWELVQEFRMQELPGDALGKLCSQVILERMFPEDGMLLMLSARAFHAGTADSVILDYLCEFYNGLTEEMSCLLDAAAEAQVETYDLEERLLAQMLFTGETGQLDRVFLRFRDGKKTTELMVRAYMTERAACYFLKDEEPGDWVFQYLELLMREAQAAAQVPLIYRLALTRHYAEAEALSEEQKGLAEEILPGLLDEGLYFSYYKNLARFIPVPEEILDRECVEFRGSAGCSYEIRMRILPDETEFHLEELPCMYMDRFVKRAVLFDGERWEYEIRKTGDSEEIPESSGAIVRDTEEKELQKETAGAGSRYDCLNAMVRQLGRKDESGLRAEMTAFAAGEDLAAELFQLE